VLLASTLVWAPAAARTALLGRHQVLVLVLASLVRLVRVQHRLGLQAARTALQVSIPLPAKASAPTAPRGNTPGKVRPAAPTAPPGGTRTSQRRDPASTAHTASTKGLQARTTATTALLESGLTVATAPASSARTASTTPTVDGVDATTAPVARQPTLLGGPTVTGVAVVRLLMALAQGPARPVPKEHVSTLATELLCRASSARQAGTQAVLGGGPAAVTVAVGSTPRARLHRAPTVLRGRVRGLALADAVTVVQQGTPLRAPPASIALLASTLRLLPVPTAAATAHPESTQALGGAHANSALLAGTLVLGRVAAPGALLASTEGRHHPPLTDARAPTARPANTRTMPADPAAITARLAGIQLLQSQAALLALQESTHTVPGAAAATHHLGTPHAHIGSRSPCTTKVRMPCTTPTPAAADAATQTTPAGATRHVGLPLVVQHAAALVVTSAQAASLAGRKLVMTASSTMW